MGDVIAPQLRQRLNAGAQSGLRALFDTPVESDASHIEGPEWSAVMTSHVVRTPLTSLLGLSAVLNAHWDSVAEAERRALAQLIEQSSSELVRVLSDVLAIYGVERRPLAPRPGVVRLRGAMEHAAETCSARVRLRASPSALVHADPFHVHVMLMTGISLACSGSANLVSVTAHRREDSVLIRFAPGASRSFRTARHADQAPQGRVAQAPAERLLSQLARENGGAIWREHVRGETRTLLHLPAPQIETSVH